MTDRLTASSAQLLRRWTPPSTEQAQLREHYLAHLAQTPTGWSRSTIGEHLTASSLICAVADRQVLLTLHRRIGRWLQTGGHIEAADAELEAAALREAAEESGLADLELDPDPLLLSRHAVPCGPLRPTYHLDVQFLVTVEAASEPRRSSESADVRWFPVHALPSTDDSVLALVEAAETRLGWS